jgi:hypothetical protein
VMPFTPPLGVTRVAAATPPRGSNCRTLGSPNFPLDHIALACEDVSELSRAAAALGAAGVDKPAQRSDAADTNGPKLFAYFGRHFRRPACQRDDLRRSAIDRITRQSDAACP